jgi:ribose/xylose/arabinose/galactoside ABC-type transport system permease subunit
VSSHRHFRSITGLDLLNVSSYYQLVVKGVIIVAAVWLGKRGEK